MPHAAPTKRGRRTQLGAGRGFPMWQMTSQVALVSDLAAGDGAVLVPAQPADRVPLPHQPLLPLQLLPAPRDWWVGLQRVTCSNSDPAQVRRKGLLGYIVLTFLFSAVRTVMCQSWLDIFQVFLWLLPLHWSGNGIVVSVASEIHISVILWRRWAS